MGEERQSPQLFSTYVLSSLPATVNILVAGPCILPIVAWWYTETTAVCSQLVDLNCSMRLISLFRALYKVRIVWSRTVNCCFLNIYFYSPSLQADELLIWLGTADSVYVLQQVEYRLNVRQTIHTHIRSVWIVLNGNHCAIQLLVNIIEFMPFLFDLRHILLIYRFRNQTTWPIHQPSTGTRKLIQSSIISLGYSSQRV